jgi:hypothetical protein
MAREYLADEITMIQSDNMVLKQELELVRMTSERKAEENRILKADLTEVRALYAEKVDEAAALRTILESIGHNVSAGLTRFMERRALKQNRETPRPEQAREAVVASYREEQRAEAGAEAYAPPRFASGGRVQAGEPPPPAFLQRAPRGDVQDHPLLPRRSDEEIQADLQQATRR